MMLKRFFLFLKEFWHFARHEHLGRIFLVILVLIAISTVGLYIFEPHISLINALWWSVVTLTTVGYGDITPTTLGGRIIGIIIMFLGIGLLGTFTATVASFFVERKLKEDKGMKTFPWQNHIILCGWNFRARRILEELRKDPRSHHKPVVLIAPIPARPIDDEWLHFIQGEVEEETLKKAGIEKADSVVILGDDRLDESSRDAKAVLAVLTVESLNPNVYTVVELVDENNVVHCQRAHADEIIVGSEFNARLLARAALDHGISKVLFELLSSQFGNDLLKMPVPKQLIGKTFLEALTQLKSEKNGIVVGIQQNDGSVTTNPPADYVLQDGEQLILIQYSQK